MIPSTERDDISEVLAAAKPKEALYVRSMLRAGRIDGTSYVSTNQEGKACGCLLGTLYIKRAGWQKASQVYSDSGYECNEFIETRLAIPRRRGSGSIRPSESAFTKIAIGETPATSTRAAEIDDTITELMLSNPDVYGRVAK